MKFKDLKKRAGLSTKDVAKKLNVKLQTYQHYESCVRLPSAFILYKMLDIYKCSADDVFTAYKNSKEIYDARYKKNDNERM